ncbi:hypothetical protein [Clostridium sp.]|jgi:hypothetical protein|uniref:hypothetical protein n=1 Tax=Clostridium sp. TaxID=1506 RepID=UPI003EEF5565
MGAYAFTGKGANFHSLSTNDLNILLELIYLVKEPIDFKNLENSFNYEEILSYCSKYSLPFCDNNSIHEYADESRKFVYSRIPIKEFYIEVSRLYLLFNLWKAISEDNEDSSKIYALQLFSKLQDFNMNSYRHILSSTLDNKMNTIRMKVSTLIINNLYLDTDNLLSMCYFQLANLNTKSNQDTDKHLKICVGCRKIMWVAHGNTTHCKNCNRKTLFSRNKKNAKKNTEG